MLILKGNKNRLSTLELIAKNNDYSILISTDKLVRSIDVNYIAQDLDSIKTILKDNYCDNIYVFTCKTEEENKDIIEYLGKLENERPLFGHIIVACI